MNRDELDKVEQPAIDQLQQLGWHYIHGSQLSPDRKERASRREVVLVGRLDAAIKRINPWISDDNLRKVSRALTLPVFAGLMEYNQAIYQTLINYQSVEQDIGKGRKGQTVKIIDFDNIDNNEFLCTSQLMIQGAKQKIIPDIVCFVNGLPLVVIECKSPYITNPMAEGINQLRRFANIRQPHEDEGAAKLFWYNALMISTCRDQAKVGTISSSAQHYGDWKDAYPFTDDQLVHLLDEGATLAPPPALAAATLTPATLTPDVTPQQRMLAGMLSKPNLLDIVQNFILYEPAGGQLIKKVARYQQFRAVNKVIERLKSGKTRRDKSGIIWHTQGSGKSLTMVMLAVKMRRDPVLKQYKLVFVTDRTQLDEQLSNTFRGVQGEAVHRASSVAKLRELLKKDASDLVTAMVQKFQDAAQESASGDPDKAFIDLNASDKIIVLADEAHRTQFGSLAATINAALPNAPKIGFTGTPLLKTQKMSNAFGGYIDAYKINEAVADGATVRILYEGREVQTEVAGPSLDKLFDEKFENYTKAQQQEIKKKYGVDKAIREAPDRIRWVCTDLLKHYQDHIQPDGFKAMIVTASRRAAAIYKQTLETLGAPPSAVIISGDNNDEACLVQHINKVKQKKDIADFTKPLGDDKETQSPIAFLIVTDMLLTGFDAPIAQVMYIDRKLQDHTLMQAIARVNRSYKNKTCGFVVDYYGLSEHLIEALDLFTSDDVEGTYQSLKDEIPKLAATHTVVMGFFKKVPKDNQAKRDVDAYVLALKNEAVRSRFEQAFKNFAKQMNIILPDKAALPFVKDLLFLGKVQHATRERYRQTNLDFADIGAKVRALVDQHIMSTGVDPRIPPVDLLDAKFKEKLNQVISTESKASEVENAIVDHITVNLEQDPAYYQSLSLKLRDIILKHAGKWERQLALLLEMVDTIEIDHKKAAASAGLSKTEYAFYGILAKEVASLKGEEHLDDDTRQQIKQTTQALVNAFDEATQIVDFFNKPDEMKRMKKLIKWTINDQSFGDPSIVNSVQERFMTLAKTKFGKETP